MAIDKNRLEFERIRNLVQGFGWEVKKEEVQDDQIVMTLAKKRIVPIVGTEGASSS